MDLRRQLLGWLLIIQVSFLGCTSSHRALGLSPAPAKSDLVIRELSPYLSKIKEIEGRTPANSPANSTGVKVHLPSQRRLELPTFAISTPAAPSTTLGTKEIRELASYILKHRVALGAAGNIDFVLKLRSQDRVGEKIYVRLDQHIRRFVRGTPYSVPIEGASIVATIIQGRLERLASNLVTPIAPGLAVPNAGFQFAFSDRELAKFIHVMKTDSEVARRARSKFEEIARRSGSTWDSNFFNRRLVEQRQRLNVLFGSLNSVATARILIDLARNGQLKLVRYGNQWMYQSTGFFDVPVEFDLQIPNSATEKIIMRNLRLMHHRASQVRSFESPLFPGGPKTEGGPSADAAKRRMKQVVSYFVRNFEWNGYTAKTSADEIQVHTKLRNIDLRENAAWIGKMKTFIVGEGGATLHRLEDSLSVLGHEYAHAIIDHSSGLTYKNESGALNEHFADIQGLSIEAELEKSGETDYTIGANVLTPAASDEKTKLLDLIFLRESYSEEEIRNFSLDKVSLRHLYAPILSLSTQYDHVNSARTHFGDGCQPSIDNDNCGVHSQSGIPNKAAARIISVLGLDATRSLFFNTLVYRLTNAASFTDYVVELHDECLSSPEIASRCDIILASFASVGIKHPDFADAFEDKPQPQMSINSFTETSASPSLRFCGWVKRIQDGGVQVFDNKYNATVIRRNHPIVTQGESSSLDRMSCACVTGRVAQTTNPENELINAILKVELIENRGNRCAEDPTIRHLQPHGQPPPPRFEGNVTRTYCGWVSVNSDSKNVTIIDNRFDAALLTSGYATLTRGNYDPLYALQCACVKGKLGEATNSKGTVFNYFTEVDRSSGIIPRDSAHCSGLEWR